MNITNEPYSDSYYITILWEILLRSQETVRYGSLLTRMAGTNNQTEPQPALQEVAKYDSENLFNRVSESFSLNQVFKDITNVDELIKKISNVDEERINLYKNYDTVTPQTNTRTYEYSYTEIPYTVNPQTFTENSQKLIPF